MLASYNYNATYHIYVNSSYSLLCRDTTALLGCGYFVLLRAALIQGWIILISDQYLKVPSTKLVYSIEDWFVRAAFQILVNP